MANYVVGPVGGRRGFDHRLRHGRVVLENTQALTFMPPEGLAAAAAPHHSVTGFFSSRERTGTKVLQNAVLRFGDEAAAWAAAADRGAAAQAETVITPPVTAVPITGQPRRGRGEPYPGSQRAALDGDPIVSRPRPEVRSQLTHPNVVANQSDSESRAGASGTGSGDSALPSQGTGLIFVPGSYSRGITDRCR